MRLAVIVGGRTAEAQGTVGSAGQLDIASRELGHSTEIISIDAASGPDARMSAVLQAADHDVVIPLIPGLEGTLELLEAPFVGSGPAAAGIAAHKGLFNDLLVAAGLRKVPYVYGSAPEVVKLWRDADVEPPAFVKPARLGASYGITRVTSAQDLEDAVQAAAEHDPVVLIEQSVPPPFTEYEVPVITGRTTVMAPPGKVRLPQTAQWHDTVSKYSLVTEISRTGDNGLDIRLMETAAASVSLAGVTCASRVDLFVDGRGEIYVGEINALPGHGVASTFPRIFELAGIPRARQLEIMIDSALFHSEAGQRGAYTL